MTPTAMSTPSPSRARWRSACAFGLAAAGTAGCWVATRATGSSAATRQHQGSRSGGAGLPRVLLLTALDQDVDIGANCSAPGQPCWESGCCQDEREACYMKDLGWAQCQPKCRPGVHLDEAKVYQTAWSCLEVNLSLVATPAPASLPCSAENEGCLGSRCCKDPLNHCFLKDATWAQCMSSCDPKRLGLSKAPGDKVPQPWSCARLRKGQAPPAPAPKPVQLDKCAGVTQDCRNSSCCLDDFMGCYERDKAWAGCLRSCQAGGGWTCNLIAPARQGRLNSGRSLFCFALMLPFGSEVKLLQSQFENQVGIFQCDRHRVFSNQTLGLGMPAPGRLPEATKPLPGSLVCHPGGIYMTALNTEIFLRVWRGVFEDKQFLETDWTAKVDPDAVFLPSRLKQHVDRYLRVQRTDSNHPVYLNNCKDGLHGPLAVASKGAMVALHAGLDICERELKHEFLLFGEDVFFRHCMLILGVQRFDDLALLYETACDPFPNDPMPCTPVKVAFHPLKSPDRYMECLLQAEAKEKAMEDGTKLLQVGI